MPWKASKSEAEERQEFCEKVLLHDEPLARLCRQYGISRKTGYKWIKRYKDGESLNNLSRRPKSSPEATPLKVVKAIVALRTKHRFLGGAKIGMILKNRGLAMVPSGTTITSILRDLDMLDKKACSDAKRFVRFVKNRSNEMWQFDFKGHFLLKDGTRCHPLTGIDDYSRFCICCEPLTHERKETVIPVFERLFREYGLPFSILCDNGSPWGVPYGRGISCFETRMMELGVLVLHGRARHPQTQGKDERFNRTVLEEAIRYFKLENMKSVREELLEFVDFYNNERPHCGIGNKCPANIYEPSPRQYPDRITDWEYPIGAETRTIYSDGRFTFKGREMYLSQGMLGKRIAIVPSSIDGSYNVLFRQFLLGRFNLSTAEFEFVRPYLIEGDPREETFPGL